MQAELTPRRLRIPRIVTGMVLCASAAACGGRAVEYESVQASAGRGGRGSPPPISNGTGGVSQTEPPEPQGRAGAGSAGAPSQGNAGATATAGSGGSQNADRDSLIAELEGEGAAVREIAASPDATQTVAISAPILPRLSVLYASSGENYPNTESARIQLARDASLTYGFLLKECAPEYPKITLWKPGAPALSLAERVTNQEQVADCAYTRFFSKPYFIPQLLEDVNVCGVVLGQDWRLLDELDLASMTEEDFAFFEDVLAPSDSPSADIFVLTVYVSTKSGIQEGTLERNKTPRVRAIAVTDPKEALQKSIGVRCIRQLPQ